MSDSAAHTHTHTNEATEIMGVGERGKQHANINKQQKKVYTKKNRTIKPVTNELPKDWENKMTRMDK